MSKVSFATRFTPIAATGASLAALAFVPACAPSQEELEAGARCSPKVLAGKEDARRIAELAPDGIDEIKTRDFYRDTPVASYESVCLIGDEDGNPVLTVSGVQISPGQEYDPADVRSTKFPKKEDIIGAKYRITSSTPSVSGITGEGSASLRVPCKFSFKSIPDAYSQGILTSTVMADNAPEAASTRQRQNAADLALSFLRHEAKWCENSPKIPKSVKVER